MSAARAGMTGRCAWFIGLAVAVLAGGCRPRPGTELRPNAIDGRFRLSVWNVAESSFVRRPEAFRRILKDSDADLFSFDEVGEHVTPEQLRAVLHGLRGSSDTVWHLSWGVGGDYQRTVIASRSPVEAVPEFTPLPYPARTSLVMDRAPDSLHARLRADFSRGVATNAAVVRVRGRRLLLVGLDLWARGNAPDSWEETRRRVEAAAIRDAITRTLGRLDSAKSPVDGVVVGGDMNLVAGRAPLDTLLGLASGRFRGLALASAVHADGWSTWTWDGRGGPFHSARMDVILFSDATLHAVRARVVNWDELPLAERTALGLAPPPAAGFSRHRPVVVDFEWR